jgi:DNA-binding HxlR family transcriptional regulator
MLTRGAILAPPPIGPVAKRPVGTPEEMIVRRKSFENMECPIARSLERVGEWWSILILRDALKGISRFDAFEASLKIAPNMLTRRLNALVEDGLLERRLYSERPQRHEYIPTARGHDFLPVLVALAAFGNRHFAPDGEKVQIVDLETGGAVDAAYVDRATGEVLTGSRLGFAPVPEALATAPEHCAKLQVA